MGVLFCRVIILVCCVLIDRCVLLFDCCVLFVVRCVLFVVSGFSARCVICCRSFVFPPLSYVVCSSLVVFLFVD